MTIQKGFPDSERTIIRDPKADPFQSAAASPKWFESGELAEAGNLISVSKAKAAQGHARKLAEQVANMYENPSPYCTRAENARQLAQTFDKLKADAHKQFESTKKAAEAEQEAARRAMAETLEVDTSRASEIRQYLRGLDESERHQVLNQAVKAGDAETIRAATEGPGYLAGVNPDTQHRLRESFMHTHAPEAAQQLKAAEKAQEIAAKAVIDAVEYGMEHIPAETLKEAESREAKRRQALEGEDDGQGAEQG